MYSATKSFVNFFSQGTAFEVQDKVDILAVTPGYVSTKMTKMNENMICISAKKCASGALDSLGKEKISYANVRHALMGAILGFM